jgi:plastocyanin
MRFRFLLLLWSVGAFLPATAAITTNINYGSYFFLPSVVSIHAGDTVVWTNGFGTHTLLGTGSDAICGGAFLPCSRTFSTPGTYVYECTITGHASRGMTGVVNVASAPLTPAVLTNAMRLANGQFQFTIISTANRANTIQASTNISSSSNWLFLSTVTSSKSTFTFTDTNAPRMALRFYRVVESP